MQTIGFFPRELEKTIAPEALTLALAAELQRADLDYWEGRLRRGMGCVRADVAAHTSSIIACGAFVRRDGTYLLVTEGADGQVEVALDPLPLWHTDQEGQDDAARAYGGSIAENVAEVKYKVSVLGYGQIRVLGDWSDVFLVGDTVRVALDPPDADYDGTHVLVAVNVFPPDETFEHTYTHLLWVAPPVGTGEILQADGAVIKV